MRILYVSQYFPPEMGAPASRVSELSRHWVERGDEVTVLTGFPNHPTGVISPEYAARFKRLFHREEVDGVDVVRTWLIPLPNRKPLERILNYSSFFFSACLRAIWLRRPGVVIATSPQLLVGLVGWWIRLIKRVPFVFEVRDLWPDAIIASGVGSEDSLLAKVLRSISGFLYRSADHIVVVSPAFETDLIERWKVEASRISVVQNGVETDLFDPSGVNLRSEMGLDDSFVVSYIGTLGLAHGLRTILDAAVLAQDRMPDVVFLIVGEGADKDLLTDLAREKGLKNLRLVGQQPRSSIPALIRTSDACLVLLKKAEVFRTVIPTKLLEFMSCGRPVILGVEGQAKDVLDRAGGGLAIPPEDPEALVGAIEDLRNDQALRKRLGERGRSFMEENLSRASTAETYSKVLKEIAR